MKETGIIMSDDHPKLILDGTKTMTRRTYGLSLVNDPPQSMADWQLVAVFQDGLVRFATPDGNGDVTLVCPYGQVGDRLWVRETWAQNPVTGMVFFRVDADFPEMHTWRPSIHMPRWASRITRDITLLRVEQLRDITEEDAQAEGGYSIEGFIKLFIKINHLPDDANPWNWVIGW